MLQQTVASTVVAYYTRFLERFPSVVDLADADEQEVLSYWAGLGYYRRAKQLHAAAQRIRDTHGGVFPTDFDQILDLPGVGRYTAGAISSFAYDQPRPIVEANTLRLYARLLALRDDPRKNAGQTRLWQVGEHFVANRCASPGRINQALIELGSQVCTAKNPQCTECPLSDCCFAYREGSQNEIPSTVRRPAAIKQTHVLLVIEKHGKFLLRQNPESQWWAGLWDFPRLPLTDALTRAISSAPQAETKFSKRHRQECEGLIASELELDCQLLESLFKIRHAVTKYQISVVCFQAGLASAAPASWHWKNLREITEELPLSSPATKVVEQIKQLS